MCRRVAAALGWLWIMLLALIGVSRFFAAWAWPIDLLGNVSYFVAIPALLTLVVTLLGRCKSASLVIFVTAIIAVWPVRWMLLPHRGGTAAAPAGQHLVRVLEANVHGSQRALDGLIAMIDQIQPDVVVAIEVPPGLEGYLTENPIVKANLPFAIGPEPGMLWRDVMLSRDPLHRLRFDGDLDRYMHIFAFRRSCFIDAPEGRYLISAMHPPSPREAASWQRGNEWTSLLAEVCRGQLLATGVPVILAGDFNSTPSGYRHGIMLKRSGLAPSDVLGGLTGTWPSDWPGPLRLTIDRVWVSPDVQFVSREVVGDIGSDHRPSLVTLSVPSAPVGGAGGDGR